MISENILTNITEHSGIKQAIPVIYICYGGVFMICSFSSLRNKEIVNMKTGLKIGYVDDMELDTADSNIVSLIIYGKSRAFGIMGRDEDVIIKCSNIELIGEDTILVNMVDVTHCTKQKSYVVENLLK